MQIADSEATGLHPRKSRFVEQGRQILWCDTAVAAVKMAGQPSPFARARSKVDGEDAPARSQDPFNHASLLRSFRNVHHDHSGIALSSQSPGC